MKNVSFDLRTVMQRAAKDEKFFQAVHKDDPAEAFQLYDLQPYEINYLKSFTTQADIEDALKRLPSPTLSIFFAMYAVLYLVLAILVVAYAIGSQQQPDIVRSMGVPNWNEISSTTRTWLALIAISSFVAFVTAYILLLRRLSATSRNIALLVMTVAVFVPFFLGISRADFSVQAVVLRLLLIVLFTVLPAAMYSLFIATKGKTLYDELEYNVKRLDPVKHDDVLKIYKKKFIAMYGPVDQSELSPALLRGEAAFPVLFATVIIGSGWVMYFFASNQQILSTLDVTPIFNGLTSPFTFGFLGAYLFSVLMLFRRYVQSDLKSVAYTHVSQRILTTWIWAFVLSVFPWQAIGINNTDKVFVSIVAFTVGIFPDIAWQILGQWTKWVFKWVIPTLREEYPLDKINGMTIWMEARLLEEGIENIENLVTMDIIELLLRTNLKPQRIVDWIDQGVMILHVSKSTRELGKTQEPDKVSLDKAFNERGFLTATDLIINYEDYEKRHAQVLGESFLSNDRLDRLIGPFVKAIRDDPNMYYIKSWREYFAKLDEDRTEAIERLVKTQEQPEPESKPATSAVSPVLTATHPQDKMQEQPKPAPTLLADSQPLPSRWCSRLVHLLRPQQGDQKQIAAPNQGHTPDKQ